MNALEAIYEVGGELVSTVGRFGFEVEYPSVASLFAAIERLQVKGLVAIRADVNARRVYYVVALTHRRHV